jgi:hypothetical protein
MKSVINDNEIGFVVTFSKEKDEKGEHIANFEIKGKGRELYNLYKKYFSKMLKKDKRTEVALWLIYKAIENAAEENNLKEKDGKI